MNVLITAEIHPYLQQRMETLGFSVEVKADIERAELLSIIDKYDILIITTYTKADAVLLDKAVRLKIIGRVGSGMENVNIKYAQQKHIHCINSPEGNGNAVGEHSLAMLLCLMNNITKSNIELKQSIFQREANRGVELDGKTVGIIGYGHTGKALAKKLRGFEVDILVYDKYHLATDDFVKNVSFDDIQKQCDVISFHVPYNDETHHYCNADFMQQCAKKPIIINTSRGAVLDTIAVLQAVKQQQINGLCIDVFEDEPITKNQLHSVEVYQQLLALPNVVATPHIAGWTHESKYKLVQILMDKIEWYLSKL